MSPGIQASGVIGGNIHRFRRARGYTQAVLAAKLQCVGCDISRAALSKLECGIRSISVDELEALRVILTMEYSDFFVAVP